MISYGVCVGMGGRRERCIPIRMILEFLVLASSFTCGIARLVEYLLE